MNTYPWMISTAAEKCGINAKMIRHYERIGLVPKAVRNPAGYRLYSDRDIHEFVFIKQARKLGFQMETIKALLMLWRDKKRPSQKVKELAQGHVEALKSRIADLQRTLERLVQKCHGDHRPNCPILESLEQGQITHEFQ